MKAKRLLALLIAVVLVVGIFAVPASAAATCPTCGSKSVNQKYDCYAHERYVSSCAKYSYAHNHHVEKYFYGYTCSSGHYWEVIDHINEWC